MQHFLALVVDDSRVARMTLNKLLQAHRAEIVEKSSAEEAIDWLASTSTLPDIIFMDVMMAGMDGLTASKQIKAHDSWKDIPIIVCTGNETEADYNQALEVGAQTVLSKPPDADAVSAILTALPSSPLDLDESAILLQPFIQDGAVKGDAKEFDIEAIITSLKQRCLPELEERLQTIAQEFKRELPKLESGQSPEAIASQVHDITQQQFADLKQSLSLQLNELVMITAEPVLKRTLKEMDLTGLLNESLEKQSTKWLEIQQDRVRDSVLRQLQHDLNPLVARNLEKQVNDRVLPLIRNHVGTMEHDFDNRLQEKLDAMKASLFIQRNIAMLATAVSIVALIVAVL